MDRTVLAVDRHQLRPSVARNGRTTGPAAIRLSLLASPSRLPARSVSTVTGSPANPTTPLITTSADDTRSASSAMTSTPGNAAATSARRDGSATATTDGRNSRAWSISCPTDDPTPSATTWYRSGPSARITSSVWVPIEPVEPAIATRTGATIDETRCVRVRPSTAQAQASGSRPQGARTEIHRIDRESHRDP